MGWASYILYVYINSRVAKMVLSSSCINIKCVVTDFTRHYLKLAFCEEEYSRKIWPNLINIRENGKIVDEHKGFISGKWLGDNTHESRDPFSQTSKSKILQLVIQYTTWWMFRAIKMTRVWGETCGAGPWRDTCHPD